MELGFDFEEWPSKKIYILELNRGEELHQTSLGLERTSDYYDGMMKTVKGICTRFLLNLA